jgi:hypothetical protein
MLKEKYSSRYLKNQWESGNSDYSTDGVDMYCKVCSKEVKCEKIVQLKQHSRTTAHITAKKGKENSTSQLLT